ncbi:hypothetical protein V2J09_013015 [Rumex salicifolius]
MGNCLYSSARVDASVHSHPTSGSGNTNTSSNGANSRPSNSLLTKDVCISTAQILPTPRTEGEILSSPSLKSFSFNELKNATKNFRPDTLLGEGGFGCVYKGWIDHQLNLASSGSGMVVAVKKLKPEGFQGHREWLTEVNYLSHLHHPNLVRLIGYCLDGDDRLLVYEFMPKGSLENHLFRSELHDFISQLDCCFTFRGSKPLSWATRIKVAVGAAKGLSFLHDAPVIYRDFKASNILLDVEFNSKLSDFGLVKEGPTGDRTHVSTRVMGTQGYAAPEYLATGRLSARSDVYSFGVVLLELLSGRPAFDMSRVGIEQSLVDWAKPHLGDKRKLFRIMDTKLEGQYPKKAAMVVASLALRCLNASPKARPSMQEALIELEEVEDFKNTSKKYSVQSPAFSNSNVSSPIRRSVLRQKQHHHHHSPLNVTPLGSPLYKKSLRVN